MLNICYVLLCQICLFDYVLLCQICFCRSNAPQMLLCGFNTDIINLKSILWMLMQRDFLAL